MMHRRLVRPVQPLRNLTVLSCVALCTGRPATELMMDYAESATRHRLQAEECRAKADLMADLETRAQYHKMAETYDAIADNEEKLAVLAPRKLRTLGSRPHWQFHPHRRVRRLPDPQDGCARLAMSGHPG